MAYAYRAGAATVRGCHLDLDGARRSFDDHDRRELSALTQAYHQAWHCWTLGDHRALAGLPTLGNRLFAWFDRKPEWGQRLRTA
ncbi:MAG: hypothetical protein AAGA48_22200 [Myxococcota bacterium]